MKLTDLLGSFKSKTGATSHIKNLIEMAAADGQFLDSEKELLKTFAKRYGISESHLAEIQNNPEKVVFEVPKDEKQKFIQLFELVQMMGIDNHIHHNETDLAREMAIKYGYKHSVARELVDVIRQNIQNGSTPEETMKRAEMMIA